MLIASSPAGLSAEAAALLNNAASSARSALSLSKSANIASTETTATWFSSSLALRITESRNSGPRVAALNTACPTGAGAPSSTNGTVGYVAMPGRAIEETLDIGMRVPALINLPDALVRRDARKPPTLVAAIALAAVVVGVTAPRVLSTSSVAASRGQATRAKSTAISGSRPLANAQYRAAADRIRTSAGEDRSVGEKGRRRGCGQTEVFMYVNIARPKARIASRRDGKYVTA